MGQQCHVKEQYTKLWKIFTRDVQDWREKKKLIVNEEKFQILTLEQNNLQKICAFVGCSKSDVKSLSF